MAREATTTGEPRTSEHRLTPVQVARVLELAARMEDEPENTGLTLDELRDVAAEAGIPAEAIRRALAQLAREASDPVTASKSGMEAQGRPTAARSALNRQIQLAPANHRESAVIPARLADQDVDWLVKLLGQLEQIRGQVTYEPGVLHWFTQDGYRVELHRSPSDTEVVVLLQDRPHLNQAALATIGLGTLAGIAIGLLTEQGVPVALGAVGGGVSFLIYARARAAVLREKIKKRASGFIEVVRMVAQGGRQ